MVNKEMNALDIAKYFLKKQEGREEEITHMKLQKLLYYAQGFHLALFDQPLFDDPIEAWPYGPVVRNVYNEYSKHSDRVIPAPAIFEAQLYTEQCAGLLDEVYDVYGQYSAWKLSDMTHAEPPWNEAPPRGIISHAALAAYFKTQINAEA